MSPSSHIIKRRTRNGYSWHVRYWPVGRPTKGRPEGNLVHVGAFPTLAGARACKRFVDGELAAGRAPDLRRRLARPARLSDIAEQYLANIAGADKSRRKTAKQAIRRLGALSRIPPAQIRVPDVQSWIVGQGDLAPSSLRTYLGVIAKLLDLGEVEPNPARSRLLELPRPPKERKSDPPSYAEFTGMLAGIGRRQVAAVTVLEGTGLRIHELEALTWGDIDWQGGRIRVAMTKGRTAGLRFVPLVPWVEDCLAALKAPEDRLPGDVVFPGATENAIYKAMARGCKNLTRTFSPHDLRDRFISLLGLAGVPLPLIRDIAGHTKNTVTLDIYTHVLLDEPQWRLDELRRAVGLMTGLAGNPRDVPVMPSEAS